MELSPIGRSQLSDERREPWIFRVILRKLDAILSKSSWLDVDYRPVSWRLPAIAEAPAYGSREERQKQQGCRGL